MRLSSIALVGFAAAIGQGALAQTPAPLRVIRSLPGSDANQLSEISVTFDRPVAGSLDRSIDADSIFRIEPATPGRLEWRDPVTIRLRPSGQLSAGTTYTVTIANTFRSMDGGALRAPYRFSFRVRGPAAVYAQPRSERGEWSSLALNQRFDVVYTMPVDLAKLASTAYVEFSSACAGGARVIRLHAVDQRRVTDDDVRGLERHYPPDPRQALDSLRRIVQLAPDSTMPRNCIGELVAPKELNDLSRGYERWRFATHGDFRIGTLTCSDDVYCPRGPLRLTFTTPVSGATLLRNIKLIPDAKVIIRDTISSRQEWFIEATLEPRTTYALVVDTAIRDVFGERLRGNPAAGARTTGYRPSVDNPFGVLVVERTGMRALSVQHMNVDTLLAVIAPIPDSLEPRVFNRYGWANDTAWSALIKNVPVQRIPVRSVRDRGALTNVRLPAPDARRPGSPTLYAVRVKGRSDARDQPEGIGPIAVVQVTDLGVHARVGANDAAVWVTGVNDGLPKQGATVVLYDAAGKALATGVTDVRGLVRFTGWKTNAKRDTSSDRDEEFGGGQEGFVKVTLGDDRAVASINQWDEDLSPWRFNVMPAWGDDRIEVAGAVFTERGIYRPGERVYAKAIVRDGPLGALRTPSAGDSLKWRFHDRDDGMLREVTMRLSSFGTASQSIALPTTAAVGYYEVEILAMRQGAWRAIGRTSYRVAEYRPPEFLVDVRTQEANRLPGDTLTATVQSRYLFGAPMGRAAFTWTARQSPVWSWELEIPGIDSWYVGDNGSWWEENVNSDREFASGTDTLDVRGERAIKLQLPAAIKGRASRISLQAVVFDINRQVVAATTTTLMHPADFYVAVKPRGNEYFWKAGSTQTVDVIAVRPDGQRESNVRVTGTVVRREWHRVRRERAGMVELVGDWVSDTVMTCTVMTGPDPVPCAITPKAGGTYTMTFSATDRGGRLATTSFIRWASGSGWVPWSDETQFKMDVVPDKSRYSVGDTATILFASPFTNAEAWVTVEREGLIDQRRLRITSGSTTLKFPITEKYAPNAFVSIIVTRGRSAPPGPLDDPGRPTIRVGYAELRVTPEVKRLALTIAADKPEYRPADSAHVRVAVRNAAGHGARSEVTLWAVDEGVLSLTGYKTPDPIDLIYRERGLGMRLASNLTSVAPQVPEGAKGKREAGGGGGADGADILRSRFQTTAFFLGSIITDAQGNGLANVKLPDNLTTFRVMAVAVTAGDRYGKGESSMLVTRPLLARQALPRFVRPADQFTAGAVINRRDGAAATVKVRAAATGVTLRADSEKTATLAASRGAEVRFPFLATRTDSATFRFDVTGDGGMADAVRVTLPVRPDYHPVGHTIAGVLRDSATVDFALPTGIDAARSRLSISVAASPLAMIRGIGDAMHVYPYYCTEQVVSAAMPLIALYRAQRQAGTTMLARDPRPDIVTAVETLIRRQRTDGGIGYWSPNDWSSAWLSAYAGFVLVEARDAGVRVDSLALRRLADYLSRDLHTAPQMASTPLGHWYDRREIRLRDQVAAVDFLSRIGKPDVAVENELLRQAAMLALEDRARLAEVLMRRKQAASAKRLMASTWQRVRVEGNRAVITDSVNVAFYFESYIRPFSRILTATLAVDPTNALVGPLVESLVQPARSARTWMWNTQDYASAVSALASFDRARRADSQRTIRVRSGNQVVLESGVNRRGRDSTIALTGLLADANGGRSLRLSLDAGPGDGAIYYYMNVTEVPTSQPVTPEDRGIRVERWYERFPNGGPTTSVAEGDLVRVRIRVTVPTTRQFVVLDDALPAGLEAIDLSLRTAAATPGPGAQTSERDQDQQQQDEGRWAYGTWDAGWWSPFDHREIRDDRVVYSATLLWAGVYTATYLARATTPGTFIRPPAHAEEMYNPGVNGRSDGGTFVVTSRIP